MSTYCTPLASRSHMCEITCGPSAQAVSRYTSETGQHLDKDMTWPLGDRLSLETTQCSFRSSPSSPAYLRFQVPRAWYTTMVAKMINNEEKPCWKGINHLNGEIHYRRKDWEEAELVKRSGIREHSRNLTLFSCQVILVQ